MYLNPHPILMLAKILFLFFLFLAVMDLTFLIMLIIRDGLCYGIFYHEKPLWLDITFPFEIVPVLYILRFCTTYMLVVISIERYIALSTLLVYKSKCYSYILLVVLYSSELPKLDLGKNEEQIVKNFSFLVTSNIPRFFHYEYTHDDSGTVFTTTSLLQDETYNQFWHLWQSVTDTCIPFIALGTINSKLLWNLAKSKQNDAELSQTDTELRIHVG